MGSEFSRAMKWQGKDEDIFWSEVARFIYYINAMIQQENLSKPRQRELYMVREVALDKFIQSNIYGGSVESLQKYFDDFALIGR